MHVLSNWVTHNYNVATFTFCIILYMTHNYAPFVISCLDSADVSNSEFVCGKAEDVMPELQKNMKFWEEAVGVVDPPRAGLRK